MFDTPVRKSFAEACACSAGMVSLLSVLTANTRLKKEKQSASRVLMFFFVEVCLVWIFAWYLRRVC